MSKTWIIEVLGDLHGFASMNGLPLLARQLEEATVVAVAEIAQPGDPMRSGDTDGAETGRPS